MTTLLIFWGQSLWVFHSLKSCTDFHQIIRICLPQDDIDLIRFWGVSCNSCCHFCVLEFAGVPGPKPMHGFSPNFQDILTEKGSFLNLLIEKGELLKPMLLQLHFYQPKVSVWRL